MDLVSQHNTVCVSWLGLGVRACHNSFMLIILTNPTIVNMFTLCGCSKTMHCIYADAFSFLAIFAFISYLIRL